MQILPPFREAIWFKSSFFIFFKSLIKCLKVHLHLHEARFGNYSRQQPSIFAFAYSSRFLILNENDNSPIFRAVFNFLNSRFLLNAPSMLTNYISHFALHRTKMMDEGSNGLCEKRQCLCEKTSAPCVSHKYRVFIDVFRKIFLRLQLNSA